MMRWINLLAGGRKIVEEQIEQCGIGYCSLLNAILPWSGF